jgi:hypothetical protein
MSAAAPFPLRDPIATTRGDVTMPWINWFSSLQQDVQQAPYRLTSVNLDNQVASLGVTGFALGRLSAGLYRVSYLMRVTTPATVSSGLSVGIGFTRTGITSVLAGVTMTDNAIGACRSETFLVRIDSATPVTYRSTYVSVGAIVMQYGVSFTLELVDG